MKYYLKNKIKNVKSFSPYKNTFLFGTINNNLFYGERKELLKENIDGSSVIGLTDFLIQIYDLESGAYFFYLDKLFNKREFYILNTKQKEFIGITVPIRISRGVYKFDIVLINKIDITIERVLIKNIQHNQGLIFCSDEHLIISEKSSLKSYSINHRPPLWQFNLNELGTPQKEPYKALKIIGVLDNKLWVALNNYTLIALDINTGELMHRLSEIKNFDYPFGSIIPAPESMKIDKSRNVLYALAWEYYWEINPQTGEIQMWNLFDYFQSLKLRNDLILNYVKIGNMIYFASRNDDCNYESQLAGFNVNTKKIEWQYKFSPNENGLIPQINDLKGNDKVLGALDKNNTLHIFEKAPAPTL